MKIKRKEERVVEQGTEVAVVAGTNLPALPAEWEVTLAQAAKDEAAVEQPQVQAFTLRAGVLAYNSQPMPDNKMTVVVAATAFERALFINKFDPNNIVPPLCFALAETDDDMAPHDGSFKKQNDTCKGCPHDEWGSDPNSPSGRGKLCKETRRLALIPDTAIKEGIEKATIAMLRTPVTSVKQWSTYVHVLAATAKRPPWSVLTEISVKPDVKNQFTVNFAPVGAINDTKLLKAMQETRQRALQAVLNPYATMTEEQYKAITEEKEKPQKKRKF